jgi:hypothetical protein
MLQPHEEAPSYTWFGMLEESDEYRPETLKSLKGASNCWDGVTVKSSASAAKLEKKIRIQNSFCGSARFNDELYCSLVKYEQITGQSLLLKEFSRPKLFRIFPFRSGSMALPLKIDPFPELFLALLERVKRLPVNAG